MFRRRWLSLIMPWLVLLPLGLASHALHAAPEAAPFNVDSPADLTDASPGDGLCAAAGGACTLRAAIQESAAKPDANTINIPAGTYFLTIPGEDDTGVAGDLDISGTTTIIGAGPANTSIDASGIAERVLQINGTVTIRNLTLRKGTSPSVGVGGGVYNTLGANTILDHVVITGNVNTGGGFATGGGIFNTGNLRLYNSLVMSNSILTNNTLAGGAGIYNFSGSLVLSDTTVGGNQILSGTKAIGSGGGIFSGAYLTMTNSTVSGNRALNGGGIMQNLSLLATLRLVNSTVSGNQAAHAGGGIYNASGTISLYNTTVTDNAANLQPSGTYTGGGVVNDSSAMLTFVNSIIAANHRDQWPGPTAVDDDCGGSIISQGNNFVGLTGSGCAVSGPAPLTGDPLLGTLANNGGPTRTHKLRPGSPAIDAGNVAGCTGPTGQQLTTDQRGFPRPAYGGISFRCDLGAFEVQLELFLPAIYH